MLCVQYPYLLDNFDSDRNIAGTGRASFSQEALYLDRYVEIALTGSIGIISARFLPEGIGPFMSMPVLALETRQWLSQKYL